MENERFPPTLSGIGFVFAATPQSVKPIPKFSWFATNYRFAARGLGVTFFCMQATVG